MPREHGQLIECPHCGQQHALESGAHVNPSSEEAKDKFYFRCADSVYEHIAPLQGRDVPQT